MKWHSVLMGIGLLAGLVVLRWQGKTSEQTKGVEVVVQTLDERVTGPLSRIGGDGSVDIGGTGGKKIAGDRVLNIRRAGIGLPPYPSEQQVILSHGDRIVGTIESASAEDVSLKPAAGSDEAWSIPLNRVAALWFAPPPGQNEARFVRQLAKRGDTDKAYLLQGDILTGTFAGITKDGVQFQVDKKEITIDRSKLAVVVLSSAGEPEKPKGPTARVVLGNGSRLTLLSAGCDGSNLQGKTMFDTNIKLPASEIVSFEPATNKAVHLSDLKPAKYEYTPYLGSLKRDYVIDGNADGGLLVVQDSTYDRGIGMHAASRLTFDLGGRYRVFDTSVGLDDVTGREGSAKIEVVVDGKAHGLGKEWTHADGLKHLRIDVTKVKELTLVVDFGNRANVQAQVDWIEPRLLP